MVRRHERSRVAPSAYVFPGGTLREDDFALSGSETAPAVVDVATRGEARLPPREALATLVCAVRELFEEAGVLLARDAGGRLLDVDALAPSVRERLAGERLALHAGRRSLASVLDDFGWRPALDCLTPFSHWITPEAVPLRFDTRFFVAALPGGQAALHCDVETSEGVWLRPDEALAGGYDVVFPTAQHLRRLLGLGSVRDVLAMARSKPIRRVQPELGPHTGMLPWLPPELVDAW